MLMKNHTKDKKAYEPEPGEKDLDLLIKEAGEEARGRKKKAMETHFHKLHAAVCDQEFPLNPAE